MGSLFVLLLGLRGRHDFLNLSRYGPYCEKSYRLHDERDFDFLRFTLMLSEDELSDPLVLAFDPSSLDKSGKQMPHLDRFWSGCLGKAAKGLEIGGLAVIDLHNNTGLRLAEAGWCLGQCRADRRPRQRAANCDSGPVCEKVMSECRESASCFTENLFTDSKQGLTKGILLISST